MIIREWEREKYNDACLKVHEKFDLSLFLTNTHTENKVAWCAWSRATAWTMTPSLWQLTQHFYLYLWDDDPESVTAYLTFLYYLWRRRLLSICLNHRIYTVEKPPVTPISLSYTLFLLINLTYFDLILGKRSYRLLSFAAHTTHKCTTSWVTDLKCVTGIQNFYTVTSLTT